MQNEIYKTSSFDLNSSLDWFLANSKQIFSKILSFSLVFFSSNSKDIYIYTNMSIGDPDTADSDKDLLVVDASTKRSVMSFMNDFRNIGTRPSREMNVKYVELVIEGWPRIFPITTKPVPKGQELLCIYHSLSLSLFLSFFLSFFIESVSQSVTLNLYLSLT